VDALRGLAVVFMVPLHTSHGWVRPEARVGEVWTASQFFGGLAAPIFLFLAGASLGMRWTQLRARGEAMRPALDIGRGLQLIVLGYVLRLQMWVIDGGAFSHASTYPAVLALIVAYALAYYAAGSLSEQPARAWKLMAAAGIPFALGLWQVALQAPGRFRGLLRVDVLQCIGACLVVLSACAGWRGVRFAKRHCLLLAASVMLLTPVLREVLPGVLPEALAGYLALWPSTDGRPVVALFPLFPWLAYAAVGAAAGLCWSEAPDRERTEARLVALIALGACIALATSEAWPPIFHLTMRHAWLVQPLRVAYKLGIVVSLIGVALATSRSRNAPLQVLGRSSLLIYWVHLEFAFGIVARPLVRRLELSEWALGSALLLCAMWALAYVRGLRIGLAPRRQRAAHG
jgi:uncharacterized membrane protein